MNRLMIIVPCYNEEEVFNKTADVLSSVVVDLIEKKKVSENSGVLFVNDGSRDKTWSLIEKAHSENKYVYGLNLAANVGHQNALLAGITVAKDICDISISIDADLQDDTNVIGEMVDKYLSGADIVCGVRSERKTDTFSKRFTAEAFYKFMTAMGTKTIYNHADYRLMSRRAMEQLCNYKERNLFLRGIVPLIGYKVDTVYYARKEREAGESKYPLKKMLSFAWEGITSFSVKPITIITTLGASLVFLSLVALVVALVLFFCGKCALTWSLLMISIWFIGGVQLLSLGIIGQYVGKTYIESKERPRFNIEAFLDHN